MLAISPPERARRDCDRATTGGSDSAQCWSRGTCRETRCPGRHRVSRRFLTDSEPGWAR